MAYDGELASRIRVALAHREAVTEKKMFGGLTFMVADRMCCGVLQDNLVLRVSSRDYGEALSQPHARPMDLTGQPMRGFVYVSPEGYQQDEDLQMWLARALHMLMLLLQRKHPAGQCASHLEVLRRGRSSCASTLSF